MSRGITGRTIDQTEGTTGPRTDQTEGTTDPWTDQTEGTTDPWTDQTGTVEGAEEEADLEEAAEGPVTGTSTTDLTTSQLK